MGSEMCIRDRYRYALIDLPAAACSVDKWTDKCEQVVHVGIARIRKSDTYILVLVCTRFRAVAMPLRLRSLSRHDRCIPGSSLSMTTLAEKADHSPKYRFAACSTLDRAVYRLADEQRAA